MGLSVRVSSTTAGGTANATSLGGRPAATGPSGSTGAFFENITTALNDTGHTDYRCLFVYNSGTTTMNSVKVSAPNFAGGSTVTVALDSVATNTFASYVTGVIASETTAPSISGSYAGTVSLGTLAPGQVKAVWLKRVTAAKTDAQSSDNVTVIVSASEVFDAGTV